MRVHRRHRLRIDGRILTAVILGLGLLIWVLLVLFVRELTR